jgi:hypothetical protein
LHRLGLQKILQGLAVCARGSKSNDNAIQTLCIPGFHQAIPECVKASSVVGKLKGFDFTMIRTSGISHIEPLADINRGDQCFVIDEVKLFCLNFLHGYTPWSLGLTNLRSVFLKKGYSHFYLNATG